MAYDSMIIEFAKAAYIEQDSTGKRKNSLRDIADLLLKKFNVQVSFVTVKNWAKSGNWDDKLSIIQHISKKQDFKPSIQKDIEQIEQNFVNDILQDYENAKYLTNLGYDIIIKHDKNEQTNFTKKEAMAAIKIGMEIKNRIRGLPELQKDNDNDKEKEKIVWKFGNNTIEFE